MVMHKKSFSVDVDEELSDAFTGQVDVRGYTKYRAIEGALRVFMALPPELQVELMGNFKDLTKVSELISNFYRDSDVKEFLNSLKPEDRNKVLSIAKQAYKSTSRKK